MGEKLEKNIMERGMKRVWDTGDAYIWIWWEILRERDNLEKSGINNKKIFRKWEMWVWTGSSFLTMETFGRHLRMR